MSIIKALRIIPRRAMSSDVTPHKPIKINKDVGFKTRWKPDKYLNPLLTPPPRSPSTVEDFRNPSKLGHWVSMGFNHTSPQLDNVIFHELMIFMVIGGMWMAYLLYNSPDYRNRDWAKREAFLRTHKREALGLPLIDRNVVDPDRVVLPSEEELEKYPMRITM